MQTETCESTESQRPNVGRRNHEVTHLRDQFCLPAFKMSVLLGRITGLQVISPTLIRRKEEIPFSYENGPELEEPSSALVVNIFLCNRLVAHHFQRNTLN